MAWARPPPPEIKRRPNPCLLPNLSYLLTSSLHRQSIVRILTMLSRTSVALLWAALVAGHGDHDAQTPIAGPHQSLWYNTLPGDGGTQVCRPLTGSIQDEMRDRD